MNFSKISSQMPFSHHSQVIKYNGKLHFFPESYDIEKDSGVSYYQLHYSFDGENWRKESILPNEIDTQRKRWFFVYQKRIHLIAHQIINEKLNGFHHYKWDEINGWIYIGKVCDETAIALAGTLISGTPYITFYDGNYNRYYRLYEENNWKTANFMRTSLGAYVVLKAVGNKLFCNSQYSYIVSSALFIVNKENNTFEDKTIGSIMWVDGFNMNEVVNSSILYYNEKIHCTGLIRSDTADKRMFVYDESSNKYIEEYSLPHAPQNIEILNGKIYLFGKRENPYYETFIYKSDEEVTSDEDMSVYNQNPKFVSEEYLKYFMEPILKSINKIKQNKLKAGDGILIDKDTVSIDKNALLSNYIVLKDINISTTDFDDTNSYTLYHPAILDSDDCIVRITYDDETSDYLSLFEISYVQSDGQIVIQLNKKPENNIKISLIEIINKG